MPQRRSATGRQIGSCGATAKPSCTMVRPANEVVSAHLPGMREALTAIPALRRRAGREARSAQACRADRLFRVDRQKPSHRSFHVEGRAACAFGPASEEHIFPDRELPFVNHGVPVLASHANQSRVGNAAQVVPNMNPTGAENDQRATARVDVSAYRLGIQAHSL